MIGFKQRGVALITVMLVVALAAVIASQMLSRLQLQVQRTSNITFNQQAYWYAVGAEAFAKRVLITAFEDEKDTTHLGQIWAQGKTTYPVDFGDISGEITDLQACFNLNALKVSDQQGSALNPQGKKTQSQVAFEELLLALNIEDVGNFEAEYMTDALIDWLDSDSSISSAGGAEDNDYAAKEFSYLPANNFLASVNELRVIEHFTLPVILALKQHACIIPNHNLHRININTIPSDKPELLQALLSLSRNDAEQILSNREAEGFESVNEFYKLPELVKLKITEDQKQQFVVDSEYFKLTSTANFNNSYFQLNSILQIANNNKISVISRTIGRD